MGTSADDILRQLQRARSSVLTDHDIDKQIRRREHGQRHGFRRALFWAVVGLMLFEVAVMFIVVLLQGFGGVPLATWVVPFELDEWVLGAFQAGVLVQTFALARIITIHLFPKGFDEPKG